MKRAVDTVLSRFGRLDILYNNVGGSTLRDGPVTTAPFEEFWHKIRTDLFGTWLGCHYAIPAMIKGGGGSVVVSARPEHLMLFDHPASDRMIADLRQSAPLAGTIVHDISVGRLVSIRRAPRC